MLKMTVARGNSLGMEIQCPLQVFVSSLHHAVWPGPVAGAVQLGQTFLPREATRIRKEGKQKFGRVKVGWWIGGNGENEIPL